MNDFWKLIEKNWRTDPPKDRIQDRISLDKMGRSLVGIDTTNIMDEMESDEDEDEEDD